MSTITRFTILLIILASFGLRAGCLDCQSFWSDEGISLIRSSAPLPQMLNDMPVEHMPGYFVILHYWLQLAGEQDFAVRFLSLWASVLAVALAFRLGVSLSSVYSVQEKDWWFGNLSGLAAAALLATSAFQVWYAQEARMYSLLLASGLASQLSLWKLLKIEGQCQQPDKGNKFFTASFTIYVIATTLSVYLHFYGFLVPLAQTIFVAGWSIRTRRWRILRHWTIAGVASLGLFLPWLPRTLGIFGFSGWRAAGDPWQIPERYFIAYTFSNAIVPPLQEWLFWVYATLAIFGIIGWFWLQWTAGLFVLTGIVVPMATVIIFAINNPDFHERYSIFVSGMVALCVAGSMGLISRGLRHVATSNKAMKMAVWLVPLILTGALIVGNGVALARQISDRSLHKPDFRGAAYRIEQNERSGDIILVDGPDPEKVFLHYYSGDAHVYDLRHLEKRPWEEVSAELVEMTNGAARIWELLYFHGPGPVQMWTATNGWATDPTYHNNIRVTLYGSNNDPTTEPASLLPHNIEFGPGLELVRSEVNGDQFILGDLVRIATVWQVDEQLPDYKFSLRLLREDGTTADSWDYIPQNWIAPTSMWIVGNQATDQHGILLPMDLPPGNYNITLRLYDPTNGAPVDTDAGQDVLLRTISVASMVSEKGNLNAD